MKIKQDKSHQAKQEHKRLNKQEERALRSERAMVAGIMEGSPEAVGVAVIRLECGCRKMAAVAKDGEPASKVIMYRDKAESICPKCKKDNGAFSRVTESFIDWQDNELDDDLKMELTIKVLGSSAVVQ
ncbi:conserved hypothetical protein [hydrothermal vent metagenome]|uniref:Uncharacterized protein n=1 Tax=hydrothermal vent metagenome TaxID=652676 RepID=A0A3B0WBW5_9ZZZZ